MCRETTLLNDLLIFWNSFHIMYGKKYLRNSYFFSYIKPLDQILLF